MHGQTQAARSRGPSGRGGSRGPPPLSLPVKEDESKDVAVNRRKS